MTYLELVKVTAEKTGYSRNMVKATLDTVLQTIKEEVKSKEDVTLNGVGKFSQKVKPARIGINPATLEKVNIPETIHVTFKVSKEFRKYLNSNN